MCSISPPPASADPRPFFAIVPYNHNMPHSRPPDPLCVALYFIIISLSFCPHFLVQGRIWLLKSLNHHKISCIKECFIVYDDFCPLYLQLVELCVCVCVCGAIIMIAIITLHGSPPLFPRVLLLSILSLYFTYVFQFHDCLHMWWDDDGLHCLLFTIKMNFIHCHFLLTHKIYYTKFNIADICSVLVSHKTFFC